MLAVLFEAKLIKLKLYSTLSQ